MEPAHGSLRFELTYPAFPERPAVLMRTGSVHIDDAFPSRHLVLAGRHGSELRFSTLPGQRAPPACP